MIITWHGLSCFRLEFQGRGGKVAVVTDPYSPEGKAHLPRSLSAEIVTISHGHARHDNLAAVGGNPFVISSPGEYEVKDVFVQGVAAFHDDEGGRKLGPNTMYFITAEGLHIAYLGDLKHALKEDQLGDLHNIDILFVPVGGGDVLTAKEAADVVAQFEPRVMIPMHFAAGDLGKDLAGVEPFLKAMGVSGVERQPKIKLSERDLPQEEMQVMVLERQ